MSDWVRFDDAAPYETELDVANTLKPAFDYLWREFGFDRCYHYTRAGHWNVRG